MQTHAETEQRTPLDAGDSDCPEINLKAFYREEEMPQLKPGRLEIPVPQLILNQLNQIDFAPV